jgi:hypothetical protein
MKLSRVAAIQILVGLGFESPLRAQRTILVTALDDLCDATKRELAIALLSSLETTTLRLLEAIRIIQQVEEDPCPSSKPEAPVSSSS